MSCDICGRGSCIPMFHSGEEQQRFEKVIEAFDRARDMRAQVNADLDEEARANEEAEREAERRAEFDAEIERLREALREANHRIIFGEYASDEGYKMVQRALKPNASLSGGLRHQT